MLLSLDPKILNNHLNVVIGKNTLFSLHYTYIEVDNIQ